MPHGVPTAAELAAALRDFLREEVVPGTEGRLSYMARVAGNVAAALERELQRGPEHERAAAARLAPHGLADEAALAAAIRAGEFDDRLAEAVALARAGVVEKLRISNPRYLADADRPETEGR